VIILYVVSFNPLLRKVHIDRLDFESQRVGERFLTEEEILGVLVAEEQRKKLHPAFRCHLFFTNNRLIVTRREALKEFAGFFVGGLAGYWLAIQSDKKKAEKIKELSPDEILKADKENYEIPYSEISKVELKKYSKLMWPYSSEIWIYTQEKESKFRLKAIKYEELQQLLNSVLREKVLFGHAMFG